MSQQPSKSKLSDEEIVELIRTQDTEEYRVLVERYQAKLLRYVNTYTHDTEKAADVVQNAFIKAYVNLNSFNTKRKFSSWMYRIAHNEAINFIKKHQREVRPDDEDWFDRLPDDGRVLTEDVDSKLLQRFLSKHVNQLPLKYRDPIVLHYFEGQTYQEIAEVLHVPSATVGTRIKRAKAQLKKALQSEGITYEW